VNIQVDYNAVGQEHGITAHSAYCRFHGIKKALAESKEGVVHASPRKRKSTADIETKPKGKQETKATVEVTVTSAQNDIDDDNLKQEHARAPNESTTNSKIKWAGESASNGVKKKRGRPKGSVNKKSQRPVKIEPERLERLMENIHD